jgi:hypothetical protein
LEIHKRRRKNIIVRGTTYLCAKFGLMIFRRATAFLLLLVFFAQAFSRYLLVADYFVNRAAYAANCINKDRPSMRCNGRCQLCKKLHQQDKTEEKQAPDRKSGADRNESPFSAVSLIDFTTLEGITIYKTKFPHFLAGNPIHMPREFFHPPGDHLA